MPISPSTPSPRARGAAAALRVSLPGNQRDLSLSDATLLGRDPSCGLKLDGGGISPRHAELYRVGSLWWVRDLGSRDGTYLDDEVIDAAPVGRRATLRLGADGPLLRLVPEAASVAA